ncbi:MAG: hypothetical protein IT368_06910 [Candidatus Hydrogenedentes bacterium]|nr:hypothetical protein [Candidatus Hydrogenedentota bacterium]
MASEEEQSAKVKPITSGSGRYDSGSMKREQALCMEALLSGEFDSLSDQEWVALCEKIAHEEEQACAAGEAAL